MSFRLFSLRLFSLAMLLALPLISLSINAQTTGTDDTQSTSHLDLNSNECLKQLGGSDIVIASIAFKDGVTGFSQLQELVKRRPWGNVGEKTREEIQTQLDTQSPFLIITLTKNQALSLENHRDIIRWVLVQSPTRPCQ